MSDNSIAILQAADAYRKQLQVRNTWLDTERELVSKLDECRKKVRETNDELRALGENLHAQAGGYAPPTGQAKAPSIAQTIAAAFNQDDVQPVRGY